MPCALPYAPILSRAEQMQPQSQGDRSCDRQSFATAGGRADAWPTKFRRAVVVSPPQRLDVVMLRYLIAALRWLAHTNRPALIGLRKTVLAVDRSSDNKTQCSVHRLTHDSDRQNRLACRRPNLLKGWCKAPRSHVRPDCRDSFDRRRGVGVTRRCVPASLPASFDGMPFHSIFVCRSPCACLPTNC